ncbi:hypothetical protein EZV62_002675 [Acer yangbiense]|uniref:Splicing factor YJU2 n=1 Tax=Acer yangbiense TaxID=1000413 RepID=A0A5C7J0C4_9ROSI|nr:hypothetical protein EZV62_002675 [Acer yangbiense]
MGERKVLNKYYGPDFDPSKLPRIRRGGYKQQPPSDEGEDNVADDIFKFYFKCNSCSSELVIKTDPQNSDYVVESGATRNFEPWRAAAEVEEEEEDKEKSNAAMNKALENRKETANLAALHEIKSINSRHEFVKRRRLIQ